MEGLQAALPTCLEAPHSLCPQAWPLPGCLWKELAVLKATFLAPQAFGIGSGEDCGLDWLPWLPAVPPVGRSAKSQTPA